MLMQITLHMARDQGFPSGSDAHGYSLVAPLASNGHLDPEQWKDMRALCRVRRFWHGEADQIGRLVHRPGGVGGASWRIDYDPTREDDDETGYRLDGHVFRENEYVSIEDHSGRMRTFRIAAVGPA